MIKVLTGVDIIEIDRIRKALNRPWGRRFLHRVFTPAEIEYCRGRAQSLAVRWAAKEAVYKALSIGPEHEEAISWQDIEVISAENGHPKVELKGAARKRAEKLGIVHWTISLSHTHKYAVAFAVAISGKEL